MICNRRIRLLSIRIVEGMSMGEIIDKVMDEALSLPADARVNLVERLIASLNLSTQPEIDQLWAEEAERRVSQIDKGEVKLISGKKVFARILKKYR